MVTLQCALALFLILPACAFAQQQDSAADHLRETLRNTTIQLRTAQSENAGLQVTQAEAERQRDALKKQLADLTKKADKDRAAAAKDIEDLKANIEALNQKNAKLSADLARWTQNAQQAAELARTKEDARAALEIRVAELQRTVADRESRNIALVKIATEILDRLHKFNLGDALAAREPFIGAKRVQIKNLVQDYSDKILDQKYQPGVPPAAQASPSAQPSPAVSPSKASQPGKADQPAKTPPAKASQTAQPAATASVP